MHKKAAFSSFKKKKIICSFKNGNLVNGVKITSPVGLCE